MAQVILGGIGQAIGGPFGAAVGGVLGRALDQGAVAGLAPPRQRGPRLDTLKVQGTAEGAPLACVFGRARVTGQVIWAARFLEDRETSAGGKGGPRTVEYGYSLSFAVALCEGEIDGVGRVWADGRPMELSGVTMRVHRGGPDQAPDPLIEAVEGTAPAYRGVAYVVFEDLALGPFGNRAPQLAFEVFRRPRGAEARLEDRLEGVCLIPGAGEFALATEPVMRREGLTRSAAENVHTGEGRADLVVSLDQLQAQCPNLKRVSLVIGWFGDDLRAAHCTIRPGVERADKPTEPLDWSVAGLERHEARVVSRVGDGPAYGGTPSDESVRQAVAELKRRGLEVTLYPFMFMDIPAGNGLPDPWGGAEQGAYPWRGRVKGRDGAEAASDVAALFGAADGWGLRRLALHYAGLAVETGADGLLIGSEMRGLTFTRNEAGGFPAVAALRALAAECRAVVGPDVALSYAADWSEYAGPRAGGEVRFHLDPLWADPAIDYVGVDWYPPLGDWRAGDGGRDAPGFKGPDDPAYLAAQVAGGEGFDWYYASDADRATQARTPIVDTAYGEHWVWRVKDLAGWWGSAHHERIDGVRGLTSTDWAPGMKPVRLTEFGCAAVDRGGNAPNLFQDPKSAENALPPHSTGARDDRMQRRACEAVLEWFAENNPVSAVYGGPMLEGADVWCWDARPWPAFPGRGDVWADAAAWRTGHWLNGRLGGETRELIGAILERGGVEAFEIGAIAAAIDGYVIDRPMRTRDSLEPLLTALGLTIAERAGRVSVTGTGAVDAILEVNDLALPEAGVSLKAERATEIRPTAARVRHIDGDGPYQTGAAVARQEGSGGAIDLDLPAVCSAGTARAAAEQALESGAGERLTIALGPLDALRLEPGDGVEVADRAGRWRIARIDLDETPTAVLELRHDEVSGEPGSPAAPEAARPVATPFFALLDLPPLPGAESDGRPVAIVASEPWRPMRVWAGAAAEVLTPRAEIGRPATVGVLTAPLAPGARHRWDEVGGVEVRLEGRAPESRSDLAVLAGANLLAVEGADGWELIQFRSATLVGGGIWRLGGLLRGQQGTTAAAVPAGATVVILEANASRVETPPAERGLPLVWRAGAAHAPPGGRVREIVQATVGAQARPWDPAHLRVNARADGGLDISWIARNRIDGDRWEGEPPAADPMRFRVRILDGAVEIRRLEVEGTAAIYAAAEMAADFPGGIAAGAITVAQWGEGYGWGNEARTALI